MFKYWMMPLITAMLLSFSSTTLWAAGDYAPDQTQQAVTPRSKKRDKRPASHGQKLPQKELSAAYFGYDCAAKRNIFFGISSD